MIDVIVELFLESTNISGSVGEQQSHPRFGTRPLGHGSQKGLILTAQINQVIWQSVQVTAKIRWFD